MFDVSETSMPIIRTRENAGTVPVVGGETRFLVHGREVKGAYAIIEQTIPPGGGPPLHVHRNETEIFYVVEGHLEIVVGEQRIVASSGGSAVCPRDIPHKFKNISDQSARLLVTIIPGHFGEFFERVGGIDPNDAEAIRRLAASYSVTILG